MRKIAVSISALLLAVTTGLIAWGSSHREAPLISNDPQADTADVYAFVSPDRKDSVTLIQNVNPISVPSGGPNYYLFGTDVVYEFKIDNNHDAKEDVVYQFRFKTKATNPRTFLYNTGQVTSLTDPDLNVRQTYDVIEFRNGKKKTLASNLPTAPANVGKNSMPDYASLRSQAIKSLAGGIKVFAGPADDPFFVDLRIFDLLQPAGDAVDSLKGLNVSTIALQLPKSKLQGTGVNKNIVGVWGTSSRPGTTVLYPNGTRKAQGKLVQVSRLGMPLVNEVVIPLVKKDKWNGSKPKDDGQFLNYVTKPELATLFDLIFGVDVPPTPRDDLVAVFLTGVANLNQPAGGTPYEAIRLNMSIAPTKNPKPLGVLAGDLAGFPNGRRLADDVTDAALRVVAGVLVNGFNVSPNNTLTDGVDENDVPFESKFPYVALPHSGNQ